MRYEFECEEEVEKMEKGVFMLTREKHGGGEGCGVCMWVRRRVTESAPSPCSAIPHTMGPPRELRPLLLSLQLYWWITSSSALFWPCRWDEVVGLPCETFIHASYAKWVTCLADQQMLTERISEAVEEDCVSTNDIERQTQSLDCRSATQRCGSQVARL